MSKWCVPACKSAVFAIFSMGVRLSLLAVSIIAGSSNGRTADSESVYLGSSPSPAAMIVEHDFVARKSMSHA